MKKSKKNSKGQKQIIESTQNKNKSIKKKLAIVIKDQKGIEQAKQNNRQKEKQRQKQKQKQLESQKRNKQHKRFIKMIIEHESSKQQIRDLQRIKDNTKMQISLRYMKAETNRKYTFPRKLNKNNLQKNNELSMSISDSQLSTSRIKQLSKNRQAQYQAFFNHSFLSSERQNHTFHPSRYQTKQQQQGQNDHQLSQLIGKTFYDLREQNFQIIKNEGNLSQNQEQRILSLNQFFMYLYEDERQQLKKFIKTPSIISTSCKTLSLQSMNNQKANIENNNKRAVRSHTLKEKDQCQSLQKLRIARLIERRRHNRILQIPPRKIVNSKSLEKKANSPLKDIDLEKKSQLYIGRKHQKFKTEQQNSSVSLHKKIKKDHEFFNPQTQNLVNKKLFDQPQMNNDSLISFSDTKFLKFPVITPKNQVKQQIQKLIPKKNIFNSSSQRKIKKLKTYQNNEFEMNLKQIIGKKLKTEVHTPEHMSPKKTLSKQQSLKDSNFSNIFQNQRFQDMNSYIDSQKIRMIDQNNKGNQIVQINYDKFKLKKNIDINKQKSLLKIKSKRKQILKR